MPVSQKKGNEYINGTIPQALLSFSMLSLLWLTVKGNI